MNLPQRPTTNEDQRHLPLLLMELSSVVAARLDGRGNVIEANRGFSLLMGDSNKDFARTNVSRKFVNPTFEQVLNLASDDTQPVLYQGIMTLGDITVNNRSVHGSVFYRQGEYWLIAEHDIDDLERLNAAVLSLNDELAQTHRDLVKANNHLKRKEAEITHLMLTDTLTDMPNRRHFEQVVEREMKHVHRHHAPLCFALADIDHFKIVNDTYGHDAGDAVLQEVAVCIKENLRDTDFAARWGGEEFAVMLVNSDTDKAASVVDRLRRAIEDTHVNAIDRNVTISIGLAQFQDYDSLESVLKRADEFLYQSKKDGRNRVTTECESNPQ